jgi:FlaA1/EpsC-like NDP-sugar epimerase
MLGTFNFFYRQYSYSRLVFLYFWAMNIFAVGISRSLFRDLLAYARSKGYNLRHILIAGAGNLGQELAQRAHTFTELRNLPPQIRLLDRRQGPTQYRRQQCSEREGDI